MYAVLFDIDGTLLLTGGAGRDSFMATFLEDFGVERPDGDVLFAGRSDRAIAEDLMRLNHIELSVDNWNRFVAGYYRRLCEALPQCQGRVLAGVVELLHVLEQFDHVQLGLLTGNIRVGAQAKLSHYGLAQRFAFGGYGDEHADRKDIAAAALQSAKEYAAHSNANSHGRLCGTMVIGDTANDVRCAHSIGAFAVAVATGGASVEQLRAAEPDLLLTDLSETDALLAEVDNERSEVGDRRSERRR